MAVIVLIIDWICIVLFILGFIGNLLGLVVFSSRRFRRCSTYATLALVSFTINLICIVRYSLLLHSTTRLWLSEHIVNTHWLTCKFYRLSSSCRVLAAWVTVFWVIERFLHVLSRLNVCYHRCEGFRILEKYKYIYMICFSLIMVLIVTGPTTIFSAPYFTSSNTTNSLPQCTINIHRTSSLWQRYFRDLSFGFNYYTIRFLFSEFIPSMLVGLFNIGIIVCIFRSTAHVRRRQEYHHKNQLSVSMVTGITTNKLTLLPPADVSQQRRTLARQGSFKNSTLSIANAPFAKMSWMNIVLILHSLLFFLSSSVTSIVYFSTSNIQLAYWMSVIILANCSLNFYVYCLSGTHFRTELKRIAQRYMRNLHKNVLRRCYKQNKRHHSYLTKGKAQIYHDVPLQQDFILSPQRQY